jgi:hypothetical protein
MYISVMCNYIINCVNVVFSRDISKLYIVKRVKCVLISYMPVTYQVCSVVDLAVLNWGFERVCCYLV